MKTKNSALAMFLFASLVLGGASSWLSADEPEGKASTGPRIVVDEPDLDLGQLDKGVAAEAKFTLRNAGDETLKILRAKPG
jgi:hypothetical protein